MLRRAINKLIPKFVVIPLLLALGFNCITYFVIPLFVKGNKHYDLTLPIDNMIPFCAIFILPYFLSYVQWVGSYILHCRQSKEICYHIVTSDLIAKLICFIFFVFMPTTISRPEVTGDGIFNDMVRLLYTIDGPINLFPSIHCLESWMSFRGSFELKGAPKAYILGQFIFTLLVCISTVTLKQHFFVDIFAGIAAVEIGWFISKKFGAWKLLRKIELPSVKEH